MIITFSALDGACCPLPFVPPKSKEVIADLVNAAPPETYICPGCGGAYEIDASHALH